MGFRNTVSTIGALDTGQGFAVGSVQSYTDNPTGALGSALHTAAGFQFRDGISGDTPAAVVNVANYTAQGDGALTEAGGGLTFAAGSYNGVQGPRLDLNVESVPAGGFAPVLRVTAGAGGRIVPDVALDPIVARVALAMPFNGTGAFQPYGGAGGSQIGVYGGGSGASKGVPTAVKLASGLVVLSGMVTVAVLNYGVGAVIATLPAGFIPAEYRRFLAHGWGSGAWVCEVLTNGTVTYAGTAPGSTQTAGSFLSLAGITYDTLPELP